MKRVAIVTVARSDYSLMRPLIREIETHDSLALALIVTGMHLAPLYGDTVREIEDDGVAIAARVDMEIGSDSPASVSHSIGIGIVGLSQTYERLLPDILVVLGDRLEMLAAVSAAVAFPFPIAHVGGGAVTLGAVDDALRHAITKMSHLHFVETEAYGKRLVRMGEEPWRVTVSGALGLDNIREAEPMSLAEIEQCYGLSLGAPPLLVTFHPETRDVAHTENHVAALLDALAARPEPILFTSPNADPGNRIIIDRIETFVAERPRAHLVRNLGTHGYLSLLNESLAMVGNSSSGIVETASFKLPVVNIGHRQAGRLMPANVIQVEHNSRAIGAAIACAINPGFRDSLASLQNPYGDGHAAERIVKVLHETAFDARLYTKGFHDACEEKHDIGR